MSSEHIGSSSSSSSLPALRIAFGSHWCWFSCSRDDARHYGMKYSRAHQNSASFSDWFWPIVPFQIRFLFPFSFLSSTRSAYIRNAPIGRRYLPSQSALDWWALEEGEMWVPCALASPPSARWLTNPPRFLGFTNQLASVWTWRSSGSSISSFQLVLFQPDVIWPKHDVIDYSAARGSQLIRIWTLPPASI